MNFQQLKIIRETINQQFNLSLVATALNTSASGVSKHIRDFEDELGVIIFERHGKRILGLTEAGQTLLGTVEQILGGTQALHRLAQELKQPDIGTLSIATTHTQARYILPPIVTKFKQQFPKVHLILHQASPTEIMGMLLRGEVDIGIATEALSHTPELNAVVFYTWQHCLIVPKQHLLARRPPKTLADLHLYDLITYHEGFTGRANIDLTFQQAGLNPNIVLSALDADVIKTYVELGMGVGIMAETAFLPQRDVLLERIPIAFFGKNTTWLATKRVQLLRHFTDVFITLCQEYKYKSID